MENHNLIKARVVINTDPDKEFEVLIVYGDRIFIRKILQGPDDKPHQQWSTIFAIENVIELASDRKGAYDKLQKRLYDEILPRLLELLDTATDSLFPKKPFVARYAILKMSDFKHLNMEHWAEITGTLNEYLDFLIKDAEKHGENLEAYLNTPVNTEELPSLPTTCSEEVRQSLDVQLRTLLTEYPSKDLPPATNGELLSMLTAMIEEIGFFGPDHSFVQKQQQNTAQAAEEKTN